MSLLLQLTSKKQTLMQKIDFHSLLNRAHWASIANPKETAVSHLKLECMQKIIIEDLYPLGN